MDIVFNISNTYFGPETATLRPDQLPARHLHALDRRRVYVRLGPGRKALAAREAGVDPLDAELHAREKNPHPRPPDRGRRPGTLPAHQIRRPEALLARRRRNLHRLAR